MLLSALRFKFPLFKVTPPVNVLCVVPKTKVPVPFFVREPPAPVAPVIVEEIDVRNESVSIVRLRLPNPMLRPLEKVTVPEPVPVIVNGALTEID
jgi:hypothetical protein